MIFIGFLCAFSSRWAFSYFGLSCFEQIVYHLKVPLEGTNTQFISDWIKKCLIPSLALSIPFYFMPFWLNVFIFLASMLYAIIQIQIVPYIFHQFQTSDVFESEFHQGNIKSPEKKMNLIHIYLESMETTYALEKDGGNSKEDLVPFLTKLTKENISFSNTDKIGGARIINGTGWTTGGIVGSECGIPLLFPLGHKFCKENVPFLKNIKGLGDVLEQDGYHQVFMIGSDAAFGGRKSYYLQHGHYEVEDINQIKRERKLEKDYHEFWGFEDDKLFEFAKEKLLELSKENKPFNFTMLTVDTHHPYGYQSKTCKNKFKASLSNSIYHMNELLQDFMEWLKQQDFYEDTVIVIQGDHISMAAEYIHKTYDKKYKRRVWNVFIHAQNHTNHTKNRDFTTFDLYPTILASLGYKVDRAGLGTNLFSSEKTITERMNAKTFNKELTKKSDFYRSLL